jgi:hypothetical protein
MHEHTYPRQWHARGFLACQFAEGKVPSYRSVPLRAAWAIEEKGVDLRFGHRTTAMRNYVNLAVPTMPLLVADKRGAAETKIIANSLIVE